MCPGMRRSRRATLRVGISAAMLVSAAPDTDAQHARTAESDPARVVLYAATGPDLSYYDVDLENGALSRRGSTSVPSNIQYAWPHPSNRFLYVGWSGGSGGRHGLSTFRIDPASGALTPHGSEIQLPWRPIHITVDARGEHVLVAYNNPSTASVHTIAPDSALGGQVTSPAPLDGGVYAHQIRVTPSNRTVILVARGNEPTGNTPEDPGALKIFDYESGVLTNRGSIAPHGGYGFQPRHIDFHPTNPWIYLAVEGQNRIEMYRYSDDEQIEPLPTHWKDTLDEPDDPRPGQAAGPIHVHPNGRYVYVGNRASGTVDSAGTRVAAGGENTIAVFAIDREGGEPTLIDNVDTRGFHPRTFSIDDGGRLMVVANTSTMVVRHADDLTTVPANLAVFRIGQDGRLLEFVRKHDVERERGTPFWVGFLTLPAGEDLTR